MAILGQLLKKFFEITCKIHGQHSKKHMFCIFLKFPRFIYTLCAFLNLSSSELLCCSSITLLFKHLCKLNNSDIPKRSIQQTSFLWEFKQKTAQNPLEPYSFKILVEFDTFFFAWHPKYTRYTRYTRLKWNRMERSSNRKKNSVDL